MPKEEQKNILVTGASGFLGNALCRLLTQNPQYNVFAAYLNHPPRYGSKIQVDIHHRNAVQSAIQTIQPQLVIHTAYTKDPTDMEPVIVQGTSNLAQLCPNSRFIHISSDFVFKGDQGPYSELDTPKPDTPYGIAKLKAEQIIQQHCSNAAILRMSLISGDAPLPPRWQVEKDKLLAGQHLSFYSNEIRNPIHVDDLAQAIIEVAQSNYQGPLHISGPQYISRFQELQLFVRWQKIPENLIAPNISDGKNRPINCSLNIKKFQSLFKTPLRPIQEYWK